MLKKLFVALYIAAFLTVGGYKCRAQDKSDSGKVPPLAVAPSSNAKRYDNEDRGKQKAPDSHAGIEWSNWMLVVVGALTGLAVWKQAHESTNATNAMRDSMRLQEAGMHQWVEALFTGISTRPATKKPNSNSMETAVIYLDGKVINRTPLPLTLKKVSVTISPSFDFEDFEIRLDEWLAPTSDPTIFGYAFQVKATLDANSTELLVRNSLVFFADIFVEFVESTGTKREQRFRHFLECGVHKIRTIEKYGPEIPRTEQHEE